MTRTQRITQTMIRWLIAKHIDHQSRTSYRHYAPWGVS